MGPWSLGPLGPQAQWGPQAPKAHGPQGFMGPMITPSAHGSQLTPWDTLGIPWVHRGSPVGSHAPPWDPMGNGRRLRWEILFLDLDCKDFRLVSGRLGWAQTGPNELKIFTVCAFCFIFLEFSDCKDFLASRL